MQHLEYQMLEIHVKRYWTLVAMQQQGAYMQKHTIKSWISYNQIPQLSGIYNITPITILVSSFKKLFCEILNEAVMFIHVILKVILICIFSIAIL